MTKYATTAALLWTASLATSAIFGSYFFACVFPFVAVATLAALTLPRGQAIGLVALVWAVNQAVGFGFCSYPHTLDTVGWGVAIGLAALAALVVARLVAKGAGLVSGRALGGLAAAFTAYEATLFAWALVVGGVETFAPAIVAQIAMNDAVWFVGLAGLRLVLTRVAPLRATSATAKC